MRPTRHLSWILAAASVLAGCALTQYAGETLSVPAVPGEPVPHHVRVRFESAVPDAYTVFSGPIETYRRYRVNDALQEALRAYADRASGGGDPLELRVTLEDVSTSYDEVGGAPDWGPSPHGGLGSLATGRAVPASNDIGDDRDLAIPDETHKSVTLTARVEVWAGGETLAREEVTTSVEEVVGWEDWDRWVYDYSGLFETAIRKLVVRVDELVRTALGGEARYSAPAIRQTRSRGATGPNRPAA